MPDILSCLIWVQTVCKGNQQMALGGKEFNLKKGKVGVEHLKLLM